MLSGEGVGGGKEHHFSNFNPGIGMTQQLGLQTSLAAA